MRNNLNLAAMSMIVLVVSDCSGMSQQFCQQTDWQAIGFADAAKGKPPGTVREYWQGCAERDVTVDLNQYADGHNAGRVQYCTESKGYQAGLQGKPYKNICRGELEDDFLGGYAKGRKIYDSKMGEN